VEIKKVAVIGGGTMGNGIAHVIAQNGLKVVLVDIKQEYLDRALGTIKKNLERQAKKGVISADLVAKTLDNIALSLKIEDARDASLVIEAVQENMKIKKELFQTLDKICPSMTIIASNTSSLPITAIAAATSRPDKIIGMHFMNPVPMMKLVEVIRGFATSDETFETIKNVCLAIGKTPVEANDYPGFIANRILMPMLNEAAFCLMEGVARAEDIDTVMKLGASHPMGPLYLADFIGLDVCLAIMETLYEGYNDSKYRPCPLLRKMVQAGYLGKKTGRGFYEYND
jgi:3-hydroxybutyryl-CoA dehydrogenase